MPSFPDDLRDCEKARTSALTCGFWDTAKTAAEGYRTGYDTATRAS